MLNYRMTASGEAFHNSDANCKILLGPFGSGKTTCCAMDILINACAQYAASDGVRYSRIGVIRATYPELNSTTRRSLLEVLPSECGTMTSAGAPIKGFYLIPLPDGTKVHLELELFALQSPDDCEKIKSANWTASFINEATGICPEVFAMIQSRVGRYPSMDLGGVRYGGIIADTNMPSPGNWLDVLIKDLPSDYFLVKQPPAAFQSEDENGKKVYTINTAAENLRNLGSRLEGDPEEFNSTEEYEAYLITKGTRYYRQQIETHLRNGREDIVQNQFCLLDVPIVDGRPVFTNFSRTKHVSPHVLSPIMFQPIIVGCDTSGITPAAVILQNQQGKWCVLDEVFADGEGLETFLQGLLLPLLRSKYPTNPVSAALDPSNPRDSAYAVTPKQRFEDAGIIASVNFSNSPKVRIAAVDSLLNKDQGGLLICPSCDLTIRAFSHEYRYRRLRASGTFSQAFTPQPEKNEASHIADAVQYAALAILQGMGYDDGKSQEIVQRLSQQRAVLARIL